MKYFVICSSNFSQVVVSHSFDTFGDAFFDFCSQVKDSNFDSICLQDSDCKVYKVFMSYDLHLLTAK